MPILNGRAGSSPAPDTIRESYSWFHESRSPFYFLHSDVADVCRGDLFTPPDADRPANPE